MGAMNPGTETGSFVNHLYSRMTGGQPKPERGMGCTVLGWTDRYAATVDFVNSKTGVILVIRDKATRTDANGMSENQEYAYEPNPKGARYNFKKHRDGSWREVRMNPDTGRWNYTKGYGLRLGERLEYHDFSF